MHVVDFQFSVVSDRRDGLLLALGQIVIASGFTLQRQRLTNGSEGVTLTMVVRGPESGLLQLQERLGTHHLVNSFECAPAEAAQSAAAAPAGTQGAAPAATPASAAPAPAAPAATAAPAPTAQPDAGAASIDMQRVERLLPQLARNYPNIFIQLTALERELPPQQRETTMRYMGQRVGAWVYRRDYALGGHLPLPEAVRRIALPATRQLLQAELRGETLWIANSPFCHRGEPGNCCHFLRGMLGGLLAGPQGSDTVRVVETHCRNTGAEHCSFEFGS